MKTDAFLRLWFFAVIAAFLVLGACAEKKSMIPVAPPEGVSGKFRPGQIVHLETGEILSFEQLIDRLGSLDLVFVGEVHNNPEHHLIEVQILQAMAMRTSRFSIGMEFFQENQQPLIEAYLRGKSSEETFLKRVNWKASWGFDYYLYRPLMLLAKDKGYDVIALNAPREIVRKVARSGLDSLDPAERDQVAKEIDLENEKHRQYLKAAFAEHEHTDLKNFEYFYQAQCVWEDTMAQNISDYLKKNRGKMVVFAGNGHIIYKFGIPDRTIRRIPVQMATVLLYPLAGPLTLKKNAADYVWLTDG